MRPRQLPFLSNVAIDSSPPLVAVGTNGVELMSSLVLGTFLIRGLTLTVVLALVNSLAASEPVWKTAFVKRGYVGNLSAPATGIELTLRSRTPIPFGGTKVRMFGTGSWEHEVSLASLGMTVGDTRTSVGERHQVTFAGQPGVVVPKGLKDVHTDEVEMPVKPGVWYIEENVTSATFPYAYDIDTVAWSCPAVGLKPGQANTGEIKQVRTGVIRRVDILTADTRALVACYGDSITQGYGATPDAGARYPDVLTKLIDRPTLNLGVNGDTLARNRLAANSVAGLAGVEQVVFLMGINDILQGTGFNTVDEYAAIVKPLIQQFGDRKLKVVWCTIPPAGGIEQMDEKKEALRVAVNEWIRGSASADAVADFDRVLADPNKPGWLLEDCQNDRIHPNDKGYAKMAEVAADALKGLK
jgi:lysophospholipase L1-like esterase